MHPKIAELETACRQGNLGEVDRLICAGTNIHGINSEQETLLHNACRNGQPEVAKRLIQAGIDLNAQNKYGFSALHVAVYNMDSRPGCFDAAIVLIEAGIDALILDDTGDTAFDMTSNKVLRNLHESRQASQAIARVFGDAAAQSTSKTKTKGLAI